MKRARPTSMSGVHLGQAIPPMFPYSSQERSSCFIRFSIPPWYYCPIRNDECKKHPTKCRRNRVVVSLTHPNHPEHVKSVAVEIMGKTLLLRPPNYQGLKTMNMLQPSVIDGRLPGFLHIYSNKMFHAQGSTKISTSNQNASFIMYLTSYSRKCCIALDGMAAITAHCPGHKYA